MNDWYHPSYYLDCGEIKADKDSKETSTNVEANDEDIEEDKLNETRNSKSSSTDETIIKSPCRVTISNETFDYPF